MGKKLQIGSGFSVDCMTYRHVDLDVQAVVDRLGEDDGCLHRDLIKVLFCQPCREAERPDQLVHKPSADARGYYGIGQ